MGNTPQLNELESRCRLEGVPIIRRETQSLIKFILASFVPLEILELGTAVGFSALMMAQYSADEAHIITIEDYPRRAACARENFDAFAVKDKIELIEGDALDEMRTMADRRFDFVFIDAAKAQYPFYLEEAARLLKKGGLLAADNCLQGGEILEPRSAVIRRNRTIHKRMRDFLYNIKHDSRFSAVILTVGDGIALAVRN